MSLAIWPRLPPDQLKLKAAESQERELQWLAEDTIQICRDLKHGMEDCYALLAPIEPGSTLPMSTPKSEKIKGTLTRAGTRIVKGNLNLHLRMIPQQTLTINPSKPIHIPPMNSLHARLTESIDLLSTLLDESEAPPTLPHLFSSLNLLSSSLSASAALLKGPDLAAPDSSWQFASCPAEHFTQPNSIGAGTRLPGDAAQRTQPLSFYVTVQECCVVVWLRVLEPADAPLHFGMKLGLAIGTVRRLEHDEMDKTFIWDPHGDGTTEWAGDGGALDSGNTKRGSNQEEQVYVREKVRVESADPSLISLYSKLGFLSHMLGQARHNLAAVLGTDLEV